MMGSASAIFWVSVSLLLAGLVAVAPASFGGEPVDRGIFAGTGVFGVHELDSMRGQNADVTNTVASTQTVTVTSSGNSVMAGDASAGSVSIAGNAFQNMKGVNNLVSVTGDNSTGIGVVSVNIFLPP